MILKLATFKILTYKNKKINVLIKILNITQIRIGRITTLTFLN